MYSYFYALIYYQLLLKIPKELYLYHILKMLNSVRVLEDGFARNVNIYIVQYFVLLIIRHPRSQGFFPQKRKTLVQAIHKHPRI